MSTSLYFNHPIATGLTVVAPPETEPVTLDEAKLWIRQEQSFTADDDLIESLIKAARSYAEAYQKRTLITTEYKLVLDNFPTVAVQWSRVGALLYLPLPVLQAESSEDVTIEYVATDGTLTTLDPSRYVVDAVSQPARITPAWSQPWPVIRPQVAAVQVTYTAGYEDADAVPENTKTAIKLLVAHWYRNREAVGNVGGPLEFAVKALLDADCVGGLY